MTPTDDAINELKSSWSFLTPSSSVLKAYIRDSPNEWKSLQTFFAGGPDPGSAIRSDFGKHLLHEARAKVILQGSVPLPKPPPPPPSSLAVPQFGICPGANSGQWGNTQHAQAMTLMQSLFGAKPWAWRVNSTGTLSVMDRDVLNVQAAGGTPYIILYASQGPRTIDSLPTTLADRYKNTTPKPIFTGPNEPDLDRGTKVHWTPQPLADFQKALYDQVKTVDPTYLVGSPAFWKTWLVGSDAPPYATSRAKLQEFLIDICNETSNVTGGPPLDFWAFHGYDDPAVRGTWNVWDWWFPGGTIASSETMSQTVLSHGVQPPFVNDECGTNIGAGATAAGNNNVRKMKQAQAPVYDGKIASSIVYSLYNNSDGFQIVNDDGSDNGVFGIMNTYVDSV